MNVTRVIRAIFLLALPLAVCSSGSAASLQGKVSDVFDGESIAILSQTHTLKVKLIGVAAPEKDQAYAGIARQHLADLVLNKFVLVKYSALREGYLVGQVMLGEMDICGQMIRDGVAWYKPNEGDLSQIERQIYEASQAAARSERRGLWQDQSPLAPWDFRKAQEAKLTTPTTSVASLPRKTAPMRRGTPAGLSSEDLMGGVLQPGSLTGKPDVRKLSDDATPGRWLRYQPADKHFSILAPSDGVEVSYQILAPQGEIIDLHYVIGVSNRTIYVLSWAKGPNGIATDATSTADALNTFLNGVNSARQRLGAALVTATAGRSFSVSGYTARQYALTDGSVSGVIRIFSRQTGDAREMFLLGALNGPGSTASGDEFLNSFKIK